jgi:outer membrane cobalamin receptor
MMDVWHKCGTQRRGSGLFGRQCALWLPVLLFFLLPPGSLPAQNEPAPNDPATAESHSTDSGDDSLPLIEGEEIEVIGQRQRESLDQPSSFSQVIRPENYEAEFQTLAGLMENEPGIQISAYGSVGQPSTISIRGSTPEQVVILLDGIRINTAKSGSVDLSSLPLEAIDRIEIIQGGGSAEYGPDAVGGVVNLITRPTGGQAKTSASLSYGSFETRKIGLTHSADNETIAWLFSGNYSGSQGNFPYTTRGTSINGEEHQGSVTQIRYNNAYNAGNLLTKISSRQLSWGTLTLSNQFNLTDRGQPGDEFQDEVHNLDAHERIFQDYANLELAGKADEREDYRWHVRIFNNIDRHHFLETVPTLNNSSDTSLASGVSSKGEYHWRRTGLTQFLSAAVTLQQDNFWDNILTDEQKYQEYGHITRNMLEFSLGDELIFGQERLILSLQAALSAIEGFGLHVNPKLGLLARVFREFSFKSNIQTSFRAPNLTELYQPNLGYISGNSELEPEKAINLDAGLLYSNTQYFIEVAYFRNWITNSIMYLPTGQAFLPQNTGEVNTDGIEGALELRPRKFLLLSGNYTYLRAIASETGQQLPTRPRHKLSSLFSLEGYALHYFIRQTLQSEIAIDNSGNGTLPASDIFDTGLTVDLNQVWPAFFKNHLEKCQITLEVKNIFNVMTRDSLYFPLPGRMVMVTMFSAF